MTDHGEPMRDSLAATSSDSLVDSCKVIDQFQIIPFLFFFSLTRSPRMQCVTALHMRLSDMHDYAYQLRPCLAEGRKDEGRC